MVQAKSTQSMAELAKANKYIEAKGGRKTATALARVYKKNVGIFVNDKKYTEYFMSPGDQKKVIAPFKTLGVVETMGATIKVSGSGIHAQADAVRNAIARALVKQDESFRKALKVEGFLTRDGRMVERKKYGLKKARRAPQWSKR
jgi:small subunit ribosomal protein S9